MSGNGYLYILEMMLPVFGFCLPITKDRKKYVRAMLPLLAEIVAITLCQKVLSTWVDKMGDQFTEENVLFFLYALLWFAINWAIVIQFIKTVLGLSIKDTIYIFSLSYAVEHIFYCVRLAVEYFSKNVITRDNWIVYILCLAGSFLYAYFWFAKKTVFKGKYVIDSISSTTYSIVILFLVWGLSLLASIKGFEAIHSIYAIICCEFILVSQRGQILREKEQIDFANKEQLWEKNKIRYQISKESMAVVNQHYHDMKHQIKALSRMENGENRQAYLTELESHIAAYDAVVRTGNDFLDTVLTEKKLACQSKHISMSCIADGGQMNFMDELDLYTLLGNILDNAIEANEKIEDMEKRWISVQVQNKKGVILVEVMNPFWGEIEFNNDLPNTTKSDRESHGYGVSGIKTITEKYGGHMVIKAENHKFLLRLIFQKNA